MSPYSKAVQVMGLASWLAVCYATAAIGASASIQARTFYAELVRPSWSPAGSIFGPVWTLLYTLMGIAAWLVWRKVGFRAAATALMLFLVQLAINALWSWLFFRWHRGALALADVVLLWLLILVTLVLFWRVSTVAGALLVPYLAWVGFASALNFALWRLNPQLLG